MDWQILALIGSPDSREIYLAIKQFGANSPTHHPVKVHAFIEKRASWPYSGRGVTRLCVNRMPAEPVSSDEDLLASAEDELLDACVVFPPNWEFRGIRAAASKSKNDLLRAIYNELLCVDSRTDRNQAAP